MKLEIYEINSGSEQLKNVSSVNISIEKDHINLILFDISCLNNNLIMTHGDVLQFYSFNQELKVTTQIFESKDNDGLSLNKAINLSFVDKTDNICLLDSDNNFTYFVVNINEQNVIKIPLKGFKVTKFVINNELLCVFNSSSGELYVYNLELVAANGSFMQLKTKIYLKFEVGELCLFHTSIDSNHLFTYEKSRELSMFRIKDQKCDRIANIPLHLDINEILTTDKFVCMTLKDKRVLSLLICDPMYPSHIERISKLPSRYLSI